MSGTYWQFEAVRCPYCVEGNEFKVMKDLIGGLAKVFYCTACRHLVRKQEPDFQCLCHSCRKLNAGIAGKGIRVAIPAKQVRFPVRAQKPSTAPE